MAARLDTSSRQARAGRPLPAAVLFAHRWQAIRSVKTFGDMTKTRPDRSQPWKCFSSLMCEMQQLLCLFAQERRQRDGLCSGLPAPPMPVTSLLAAHSALPEFTFARADTT